MISITCSCRGDFWVRDRLAGQEAACPSCGTKLAVPTLEAVKKKMTSAACSCGEVFWSRSWQLGKVSKCPICGGAVGPSRSRSGITAFKMPETKPTAVPTPQPRSTWGDDSPSRPPDVAPEFARGSAVVGPKDRPPLSARKLSPRALALAAGALVVAAVGIVGGLKLLSPAPPEDTSLTDAGPGKPQGDGKGGAAPNSIQGEADPTPLLKVLVPAYFYPAGAGLQDWNRLIEAASRIPVVAIVNPNTGPGTESNSDYAAVVSRAKDAGVEVIGYVSTDYGNRPIQQVEADIDRWVEFYPNIRGFFLDAQSDKSKYVDYYAGICTYAREKLKEAVVIGSPGSICVEGYFSRAGVDAAVVFQNPQGFEGFALPHWARTYQPRRFAAIAYSIPTMPRMKEAVQQAVQKKVGYLYVSDGVTKGPDGSAKNPWDHLPLYWNAEVDTVKRVNEGEPL